MDTISSETAQPNYLRRRLTTAKDVLGILRNNFGRDLKSETLLKYQEKLQPILTDTYYNKLHEMESQSGDSFDLPKSILALKHTLHVPIVTVTNLTVQPGEPYFIIWLLISSFFPLVSACMAPLGNLISLIGLVQHWRVDRETGEAVPDLGNAFGLNIASFALGIVGNASLVMNFSGKMKYLVTQSASIFCWILAATFLLIAVLITNPGFMGNDPKYSRSEGYWLAVFTIFMYYSCSIILIINFIGYKLNKYPPTFNLDKKQRLLMSYTIAFSVWQGVGSLAITHLISGLTYGTSLYYCTVSMLTIGLGDIVPKTPGAKVFALIFSFIGVIIMGLIVATIRQVILSSAGPSIFWHLVEKRRLLLLRSLRDKNITLTTEESFHQMRLLRARVRLHQTNVALGISIVNFMVFWLIGALIFHYCEPWDFFNSVYFCFLCLVTIGYGDFSPTSAFGRAFFIQWAITAIPLMTILISNVSDKLYDFADRVDNFASLLLNWRTWVLAFSCWPLIASQQNIERNVNEIDLQEEREVDEAVAELSSRNSEMAIAVSDTDDHTEIQKVMMERHRASNRILDRLNSLKVVMFDSLEDPDKHYTIEEWSDALEKLRSDEDVIQSSDPESWLGSLSPLRLPIKEPNYLLLKMFFRIEKDIRKLIESQQEQFNQFSGEKDLNIEGRSELTYSAPPAKHAQYKPSKGASEIFPYQ